MVNLFNSVEQNFKTIIFPCISKFAPIARFHREITMYQEEMTLHCMEIIMYDEELPLRHMEMTLRHMETNGIRQKF